MILEKSMYHKAQNSHFLVSVHPTVHSRHECGPGADVGRVGEIGVRVMIVPVPSLIAMSVQRHAAPNVRPRISYLQKEF